MDVFFTLYLVTAAAWGVYAALRTFTMGGTRYHAFKSYILNLWLAPFAIIWAIVVLVRDQKKKSSRVLKITAETDEILDSIRLINHVVIEKNLLPQFRDFALKVLANPAKFFAVESRADDSGEGVILTFKPSDDLSVLLTKIHSQLL